MALTEIDDASAERSHLSETVKMDHWLRLLVVVTTFLLLLLTIAVGVRLLSTIQHTLLLFALGGLLAYALNPLVEKLRGERLDKRARLRAVLEVYVLLIGLVVLAFMFLGKDLSHQVHILADDHAKYEARARERLAIADSWLATHKINLNLTDRLNHPPANMRSWGEAVAANVLKIAGGISRSLVEGGVVLVISLYFLIYCEEIRRSIDRGLPSRLRPYAEQWRLDVNRILGGFVRGQLVLALVMGAIGGLACLLIGIHLWLLIGLFVVVVSLIPVVGPFIGAVPAVVSALLTPAHGMLTPIARAVLVVILFGIINEIGSKVLYPKLVGAALGLHEVLVLFILLAGFEAGGLIGVLFAAPLTALSVVTITQLWRLWQGEPPFSVAEAAQQGAVEARERGTP